MVKNATGGSKHKGLARKNIVASRGGDRKLRTVQEEGECYANVEKLSGGANCIVNCMDGKQRICHIRGKFRGRGKRDNTITSGTWVMVGIRDYESKDKKDGKLETCDLLEVYQDGDKERLMTTVKSLDWSKFVQKDREKMNTKADESDISFISEEELQAQQLIEETNKLRKLDETGDTDEEATNKIISSTSVTTSVFGFDNHGKESDDDDIDIDDI